MRFRQVQTAILSAYKILEQMVKESSLKTLGVRENQ